MHRESLQIPSDPAAVLQQLDDLAGAIAEASQRLFTSAGEIRAIAAGQPTQAREH